MNSEARNRLGNATNLLDAVSSTTQAEALRLVGTSDRLESRQLWCLFHGAGGKEAPVQLTRLLSSESKVLLSAKVRQRASDGPLSQSTQLQILLNMEQKAVRNYSRLLAAEEQLEKRMERSRRSQGQIGELVSEARERQRQSIAKVLHTGVGQSLVGIQLNLDLMHARHPEASLAVQEELSNIQSLAEQALSEVRAVSQKLHPPDWQRLNLLEALEYLWRTSGIPKKFRAKLEIHPLSAEPSHAIRVAVYRSAQEMISNVLRHSKATGVVLSIEERSGRISLTIADNGTGFDVKDVLSTQEGEGMRGIGLRSIEEAARELGGEFEVRSGPEGTRIEVSLPLEEES
jgi:signal transduction histidine kinase